MNSKFYKWCSVLECTNTSIKTPNKLFFYVPQEKRMREKWLNLGRRDRKSVSQNTPIFFCEDHFDLPNDMVNFMQYHVMGSVSQVRMRPGCVPTKFEWKTDTSKNTSINIKRPNILKKHTKKLVEECETELEERNLTNHLDLREILPGSSEDKVQSDECRVKTEHISETDMDQESVVLLPEDKLQTNEYNSEIKTEHLCETDMDQEMYDGVCDEKQCAEDVKCISEALLVPDFCQPEENSIIPEFACNICNEPISGLRHACAQCGCELCGACAARGEHAHHFVLRIPPHATYRDSQRVLTALRQLLESLPLQEDLSAAVIKEEVKTEDPLSDDGSSEEPREECGNTADADMGPPASVASRAIYEENYMESETNVATFTHTSSTSNIPADTILAERQKRIPYRTDDSYTIPHKVKKHNRKQSFHTNKIPETAEVPKFVSIAPKGTEGEREGGREPTQITSSAPKKPHVDRKAIKAPQEKSNDSIALNIETGTSTDLIAPLVDKNTENIILIECPTESAISIEKILELSSLAKNVTNEMRYSTWMNTGSIFK